MIYLDNAATTKIDPSVLKAMEPYLGEDYGNPSTPYAAGRIAKAAIEIARIRVARFLNCKPEQIIFTSGGTEGNNMVFSGIREHLRKNQKTHVLISNAEHESVMAAVGELCRYEFTSDFLPVNSLGRVTAMNILSKRKLNTGLVSVMAVNNETGVDNPVELIGKICHENGILFHTDCVQAVTTRRIDVQKIGCDFATISSHKLHGPKGVGALYVKDPSLLTPMIAGGEKQEFGLRGGTENVAGIVGFGLACELTGTQLDRNLEYVETIRSSFLTTLRHEAEARGFSDRIHINGAAISRKIVNLRIDGVDAETLLLMLDDAGVCASAGSACNSHESVPSHVLLAMGLTPEQAMSSIRISFSRMNTEEEATKAALILAETIYTLLTIHDVG